MNFWVICVTMHAARYALQRNQPPEASHLAELLELLADLAVDIVGLEGLPKDRDVVGAVQQVLHTCKSISSRIMNASNTRPCELERLH